jgi:hypothetical protein
MFFVHGRLRADFGGGEGEKDDRGCNMAHIG